MTRYFFDVANKSYVQYDYRGREFEKPEQARELAELIARVGMEPQLQQLN